MQTPLKHIEKKNSETSGIDGKHRLSLCDVRHPASKKLESDIVRFSEETDKKIGLLKAQIYFLKGLLAVKEDFDLQAKLEWLRVQLKGINDYKHYTLQSMYAALRNLSAVQVLDIHNIIPTAGRAVIARWIIGDNTYNADNGANYGSLGTSSTAPANGDTQLTAESYRKARSSESQSSNVATLSNFYTATEVTGTFEEAGWHIDGTGSANSGQLLSHFLTGTVAKTSTETLTVESTLTIS